MTLPASGALTIAQIQAEIDGVGAMPVTIPNADWRTLAGVPTGPLVIPNDFWGKSWQTVSFAGSFVGDNTGVVAGVNFGAAAAGRRVVIGAHWRGSVSVPVLNSATIGGIAATIHVTVGIGGGTTSIGSAIISAVVPTGSSGTVDMNFSASISGCAVGSYRCLGLAASPTDTGNDFTTSPTDTELLSIGLTAPADGVVFVAYSSSLNASGTPITFTGATERYDFSDSARFGGAMSTGLSSGPITVTGTQGVISNAGNVMAAATWGS